MLSCIKDHYRQPLKMLCCMWGWLLDLWLVLKPCRFSVISLIVGFAFFGIAPQGIDILRAMSETGSGDLLSFILFYICIWLWALSIWYWARHMLRFEQIYRNATATPNQARAARMVEEVPRILGGLAFWSLWFALLKSGRIYPEDMQAGLAIDPGLFAYIYFFSGIVFYIFAKSRRWFLGKMLPSAEVLHQEFITKFTQMPRTAKIFAQLLMLISIIALLWTTFAPVSAGIISTPNLLLIAAANWVFIGSILVFYGEKYRVPAITVLIVWAFLISGWNDNHTMRTTGELAQDTRAPIDAHFRAWLAPRLQAWRADPANANKPYPLFLVAAEGGGIRAAYWTATVLGALQDRNAQFADHVYAMSGVSGGSLGIASFAAMHKASQNDAAFETACKQDGQISYEMCLRAFLRNDFLAPPVGRMLYGDLIQRFIPFPIRTFDRATAIELAWEKNWQALTGTDYFNEPFLQLYTGGNTNLPMLFLNGTWVEKGYRTLSTGVKPDAHFLTVRDMHAISGQQLRLSTAVHNSARFTFVSPAGTVKKANGDTWGHVVDGGYFENSGTTTLADTYRAIQLAAGDAWSGVRPTVLMITNDPHQDDTAEALATPKANELRSPIDAMLNTRSGRGSQARAQMQEILGTRGIYKEFGLQNIGGPVPLGWMLSRAAMNTMDKRLGCYIDELEGGDPLKMTAGQACNRPDMASMPKP